LTQVEIMPLCSRLSLKIKLGFVATRKTKVKEILGGTRLNSLELAVVFNVTYSRVNLIGSLLDLDTRMAGTVAELTFGASAV
jgi:hypothetical protein